MKLTRCLFKRNFTKNTLIALKSLIVIHQYFFNGPPAVLQPGNFENAPIEFLQRLKSSWENILISRDQSKSDSYRSDQITKIIIKYSEVLLEYQSLHVKYALYIDGKSLLKLDELNKSNSFEFLSDLIFSMMILWSTEITLIEIVLEDLNNLQKIKISLLITVVDDIIGILKTSTHLLRALLISRLSLEGRNFIPIPENLDKSVLSMFTSNYLRTCKSFKIMNMNILFSQYNDKLNKIPSGLDEAISQSTIGLTDMKNFVIFDILKEGANFHQIALETYIQKPEYNHNKQYFNFQQNSKLMSEDRLIVKRDTSNPLAVTKNLFEDNNIIDIKANSKKVMNENSENLLDLNFPENEDDKSNSDKFNKSNAQVNFRNSPQKDDNKPNLIKAYSHNLDTLDNNIPKKDKRVNKEEKSHFNNLIDMTVEPFNVIHQKQSEPILPLDKTIPNVSNFQHDESLDKWIFDQQKEEEVKEIASLINSEIEFDKNWLANEKEVKFEEMIGAGATAEVYKGYYRGTEVAIKKMKVLLKNQESMKDFKREISTLMRLRHPNLVLFMGLFSTSDSICIITEYCSGGTAFKLLHENLKVNLSWKQRYKMGLDIAKGMNYLHSNNPPIIHRDLKSLKSI